AGTKLYAVRDSNGQFEDIQTYKRAHGRDLRTTSAAEAEARQRSEAKQAATADEPKETSMSEAVKDMAKDIAEKVSDAFTSAKDGAMEMTGMGGEQAAPARKR